jgi:glutathione S-transferase
MTYGPHVHRWFVLPVPGRPEHPHLRAWYERLLARAAYKTHCAIPPT